MNDVKKILWAENEAYRTEIETQIYLENHESYDVDIELRCDLAWNRLRKNNGEYILTIIDIRMPIGDNDDWANGELDTKEMRAGEILALRIRDEYKHIKLAILTNENSDVLNRIAKLGLDMDKVYKHKKDLIDPEDIVTFIEEVLK